LTIPETLTRLENLETNLLLFLQEVRFIKAEMQKNYKINPTLDPLLGAAELAKILGVDTAYIYSQARSGKIPSIKLGKYRKFSPPRIKQWLDRKS